MSLRLTDFGTFNEVDHISFYKFTISSFSKVGENKLSRAFRYAGHIWKLQIRKKNEHLGLFVRWYGTKMGQKSPIKCQCKTGLEFYVINQFDGSKTVQEGSILEDDIYERPGSGIGYGEVIQLRYLDNIPGYLISDTLVVQVKLKVKTTTFLDKIQVTSRPGRIFVRGLNFSFHGAEWSLILFPKGEVEDDDFEDENNEEGKSRTKETEKATLYLSRDSVVNDNSQLRHHVRFLLFVEGGPSFQIEQNFHERQSQVFGTGYLMSAKELQALGSNGVIRVGVTFVEVQPYFNFAYDFQDPDFAGINLKDQRDFPWLVRVYSEENNDEEEQLFCDLQIDPRSQCKQIKALELRNKQLKTIWFLRVINFQNAEMSVEVWSEKDGNGADSSVYKHAGEIHSMQLPIRRNQVNGEKSPYVDDDGQSCIQISIVNSNYICGASEVAMTVDDVAAIAFYHNNISNETKRDYEIREQIWKMSLSNLEEEKEEILNNSREALDQQETALKDKDVMISSLQEKLTVVEGYVHSLESNSLEDIAKFNKTSIAKLIEKSKPDARKISEMNDIFNWVKETLKSSKNVASVIPVGAYGEGTVTRHKMELDIVVFLKGELEDSLNNGDLNPCLEFIQKRLQEPTSVTNGGNHTSSKEDSNNNNTGNSQGTEKQFTSFMHTPISLKCRYSDVSIVIYPTKNWGLDSYSAIYEASIGLTKESLGCFVTATSKIRSSFIRNQDEQCRDLIRAVKSWRDKIKWKTPQKRPSSYLLSLLTVQAYTTLQRLEWDEFYDPKKYEMNFKNLPLVRDPALPAYNVAESGIGDWAQFRQELSKWIKALRP
eukprot:gene15180-6376_t